jgi:type I restriction enzyme S subunit
MSELPTGWTAATFSSLGILLCGQSPSSNAVNVSGNGTPYVTGPEQWNGERLHLSKWTTDPRRVVPDGCIFITVKGAGVGTLFPGAACAIGRDVYAFLPHLGLDAGFIFLALKRNILSVKRAARGDIPGLSKADILDHAVELPPLNEQQRIVAKIDSLSAKHRRVRDNLDHIPRLVEKYKQAILAAAFRGDLTKDWRTRNAGHDAPWSETSLLDVAQIGTGSTPKRGHQRYYSDGHIPWVTSGVVNAPVVQSANEFITDAAIQETNCKVFPAGTILMAMYGEGQTRGRVAVLGIDAATNQALAAIQVRADGPAVRDFVLWHLRSGYLDLRQKAAGGVQPNLNLGIIKAWRIPLPSREEQREIVRLIETALTWIDRLASEGTSARKLIDNLDQSILAKAFRGELVPQNPADEPASELLQRIHPERKFSSTQPSGRGQRGAAHNGRAKR